MKSLIIIKGFVIDILKRLSKFRINRNYGGYRKDKLGKDEEYIYLLCSIKYNKVMILM